MGNIDGDVDRNMWGIEMRIKHIAATAVLFIGALGVAAGTAHAGSEATAEVSARRGTGGRLRHGARRRRLDEADTQARKMRNAGIGVLIGAGIGAVLGFFLGGVGALVTIPIGAGSGAPIGYSTP